MAALHVTLAWVLAAGFPRYHQQFRSKGGPPRPKSTSAAPDGMDYVFGVNPVRAALLARRRDARSLFLQESLSKPQLRKEFEQILQLAERQGVPVQHVDKGELNNMVGNRPHQGLVLLAESLSQPVLDKLPQAEGDPSRPAPVWLALDEVQDPQNLGALLRTAHFLGAAGVLVSSRNSAPLSGTTSKASAGAMEMMAVHATSNLAKTLQRSRENGWRVVGAASGAPGSVIPAHDLSRATVPTVLVLGNEGNGLRKTVLACCEHVVCIDGGDRVVDSLNVSAAGALLLWLLLQGQRREPEESGLRSVVAYDSEFRE